VAFRKDAWARVGGYPEWASHCEDILFDMALRRVGAGFAFTPDALVLFRPRGSMRAFARQYFLYARGDGVANLWPRRHAIRYVAYSAAAALLMNARRRPWLLALALPAGLAYSRAPLRRLRTRAPALSGRDLLVAAALIPAIRLVGDLAKMLGYPVGVWRRRRSAELRSEIERYRNGSV
jgi:hypothetical protein